LRCIAWGCPEEEIGIKKKAGRIHQRQFEFWSPKGLGKANPAATIKQPFLPKAVSAIGSGNRCVNELAGSRN
jgi:hypothetical protein